MKHASVSERTNRGTIPSEQVRAVQMLFSRQKKNKPLITTQSVSLFLCSSPSPSSYTPPSHCTAVAVPASRLVIAAQGSSESLPLLLSLNKQLQLSPRVEQNRDGTPIEKLWVPQTNEEQSSPGQFCFWNWLCTPTSAVMVEEMLWLA